MKTRWIAACGSVAVVAGLILVGGARAAAQSRAQFWAERVTVPGEPEFYVVRLKYQGVQRSVTEVKAQVGKAWPMKTRAETIAKRFEKLQDGGQVWFKNLKKARVTAGGKTTVIVTAPNAGPTGLVTADPGSLRAMDARSTDELASMIISSIVNACTILPTAGQSRAEAGRAQQSAASWRLDGDVLMSKGDMSGALDAYKQAVEKSPDFAVAYVRLARLYDYQGERAKAVEVLESALTHNPDAQTRKEIDGLLAQWR